MACENCINGCVNPQMCACDCASCAEANACDIPVGDVGPQGPIGPQGLPGVNGIDGVDGIDGIDGCTIIDVHISDGTDGNLVGDVVVTPGPTPDPCPTTPYVAGNITAGGSPPASGVPQGVICMWSGTIPPAGWAICDGTLGTPNLTARFIVGHNTGDPDFGAIGQTGGARTIQLQPPNIPAHTHNVGTYVASTALGGGHRHGWRGYWWTDNNEPGANRDIQSRSRIGGDPLEWTTVDPTSVADCPAGLADTRCGAHTHTITFTGNSGDGQPALTAPVGTAVNKLPPYHTLAFIMRL